MKTRIGMFRLICRALLVGGISLGVVSCEDDVGPENVADDMGDVSQVPNFGENNFGIMPGSITISSDYSSDVQFRAINGRAPFSWQITRSDLGSINNNGVYTSMTKSGENKVIVTDGAGVSVQATIVQSSGVSPIPAVSIFPATLNIKTDRQYEVGFQVSGGNPPYTWSVVDNFFGTVDQSGRYTSNEGRAGINYVIVRDRDGKEARATVTASN